jgi:hypothetical protein
VTEDESERRREALEDRIDRVRARLEAGPGSDVTHRMAFFRRLVRTREQVLVRSAPHGDTDAVESIAVAELEPPSTNGHQPAPNGRTCAQCAQPLTGKQETFCSRNCRKRFAYHRDRADQSPAEIAHDPTPRPERRHDTGTDATASVERRNGTGTYPDSLTPPAEPAWLPVARSFLDHGYALSMTIAGTAITITRSEHP